MFTMKEFLIFKAYFEQIFKVLVAQISYLICKSKQIITTLIDSKMEQSITFILFWFIYQTSVLLLVICLFPDLLNL